MTCKTIISSIAFSALCLWAGAQEPDVALATIRYELIHVNDTSDRDKPRKEELIMYMGQRASVYQSETLASRRKEIDEQLSKHVVGDGGRRISLSSVAIAGVTNERLYAFPQEGRLVMSDQIGSTAYLVDLPYPGVEWEIADEVKEINGYEAQKATGIFGGRDYTAWFTTELPFPYGPWKLHGLPGLILEASDSKNEVVFRFLEFAKEAGEEIALPEEATQASLRDFNRAKAAFDANPTAATTVGRSAGSGTQTTTERWVITVNSDGTQSVATGDDAQAMMEKRREENRRKNNNPMELPTPRNR